MVAPAVETYWGEGVHDAAISGAVGHYKRGYQSAEGLANLIYNTEETLLQYKEGYQAYAEDPGGAIVAAEQHYKEYLRTLPGNYEAQGALVFDGTMMALPDPTKGRRLLPNVGAPSGRRNSGVSPEKSARAVRASLTGVANRARWAKAGLVKDGPARPGVRDHFGKHGSQVGARSLREYDLSARTTIQNGRRFTYRDRSTNEPRVGYWDSETGFFTATTQTKKTPTINTHFAESWENLRKLPGFPVDD